MGRNSSSGTLGVVRGNVLKIMMTIDAREHVRKTALELTSTQTWEESSIRARS